MKKEDQIQPQHSESTHKKNYAFCYILGNTNILINQQINVEILTTSTTYQIPHAPKWYIGSTSLRGDILPVVNMHFLLNINIKRKQHSHKSSLSKQTLLRLKHPDFSPLVIIIDGLPYQTDISELSTHSTINTESYPQWIESSAKHNNKLYLFANYESLFIALQNNNQQQLLMPQHTH